MRLSYCAASFAVIATMASIAGAAAAGGPQGSAVQGSTTLSYRKPFKDCVGADGAMYRQVLHWKGKGTLSSNNAFLNYQKISNDVDFVQNVKSGVGVVYGTVAIARTVGGPATAKGTMQAVWHGNTASGQIILRALAGSEAGSVFVLNSVFHLRPPTSTGIDVDIVFGKAAGFTAPANVSAFSNGKACT